MARTACLVCLISTFSGCSKKEKEKESQNCGASSGRITNLKQSIPKISMISSHPGYLYVHAMISMMDSWLINSSHSPTLDFSSTLVQITIFFLKC